MWQAVRALVGAVTFGGAVAAILAWVGVRDMESYAHAFFSLDRGTDAAAVHVFGHPVYTLALGFGVRLPLHGSLGASPAALLSPYLPAPVTYWLLLTLAIAAAVLVARHALEPLSGRVASWVAAGALFCSVPMVSYTVYNDWPETAVNYAAFAGCVFAPHALLALLASAEARKARYVRIAVVMSAVWGLVAVSHPGSWPLLALTLALTSVLAICRNAYRLEDRVVTVVVMAAAAAAAVGPQAPDLWREMAMAERGVTSRDAQGPVETLLQGNLFPFGPVDNRGPFTFLPLTIAALLIGLCSRGSPSRRVVIGAGLAAIALGVGASTLSPGSLSVSPSATWGLRDPAGVFAILAGAAAAGVLMSPQGPATALWRGAAAGVLAIAALQGPAAAVSLVRSAPPENDPVPWNRDMSPPAERAAARGLPTDRMPPGGRLALWPDVRLAMRDADYASTDFPDTGYPLVTAWTKQRTMLHLVTPNPRLFDQATDLSSEVLCDADAVRFLQLRYLLLPPDTGCSPWRQIPDVRVDDRYAVAVASEVDERVRVLPDPSPPDLDLGAPALSADAALLSHLLPLPGSSLVVETTSIRATLSDPPVAQGQTLVLPVAYDIAWQPSSGQIREVGGLLAISDAREPEVIVVFRPDAPLVLRALSMTIAQALALVGLVGLARLRPSRP